jgi:hypothetical protein
MKVRFDQEWHDIHARPVLKSLNPRAKVPILVRSRGNGPRVVYISTGLEWPQVELRNRNNGVYIKVRLSPSQEWCKLSIFLDGSPLKGPYI